MAESWVRQNSLRAAIDETFVDEASNDYRLSVSSPAIDKGTLKESFNKDILGNDRPNAARPDLGAYEFEVVKKYKIKREAKQIVNI